MSKYTLRRSRVRAHRRPWILRRDGRVIGTFPTFPEALHVLRTLLSAAHQ